MCDNATESPREAVTAKDGNCGESPPNACPHRHEHVALGRRARARQLRARPGRRPARARRRRGRGVRLPARAATCAPRASCAASIAASASTSSTRTSGSPRGRRSRCAARRTSVTLHGTDLRHPRSRRITRAALPLRRPRRRAVSPELAREVPGAGERRPRRGAAVRRRPRPLPADPARRGARAARPRPRRAVPALPRRPRAAGQALRPRAGGRGRHATPDARARSSRRGAAAASTPPTPCSCPPRTRASASPCWRRSPATCPCWPRRSACTRPPSTAWPARCARPTIATAWQAALAPHLAASDPRVAGRDRAALWSARRMARRVLDAWGEVLRLPVEAPNSGAVSA